MLKGFSFSLQFLDWRDGRFFFDQKKLSNALRSLEEANVDWIMTSGISGSCAYDFDLGEAIAWFRGELDTLGIEISSHHCVIPTLALPGRSQQEVKELMERTATACAPLRPRSLVLHPGNVLGRPDWAEGLDAALTEAEQIYGKARMLELAAENLKILCKTAARHGMKVAVETMWEPLPLQNATDLPELLAAIDEPNAGYCVDSGHLHMIGEPAAKWIRIAGARLFETHFHDNLGGLDLHLPAGFGTINWLEVIKALDEVGYAGPIAFETGGWPGMPPTEGYVRAIDWWRTCESLARGASTK